MPHLISNSYFPAVATVELGFFKAEGLDADLQHIFPGMNRFARVVGLLSGPASYDQIVATRFQGLSTA